MTVVLMTDKENTGDTDRLTIDRRSTDLDGDRTLYFCTLNFDQHLKLCLVKVEPQSQTMRQLSQYVT